MVLRNTEFFLRRLAPLAAWVAILVLLPSSGLAQLSPGPLSEDHKDLEGTLNCTQCHSLGIGRPQLKCSGCHAEIAERVRSNRGYHARIVDASKGDSDCARCHGEHAGRDFQLVRWPSPMSSFDHDETGYHLEGKHGSLQCDSCHKTKSFLGLETSCSSCHQDVHRGQLGANCTSCHSQVSWTNVSHFNHQRTRFPLTGLHAAVACNRCHTADQGAASIQFKGLPFSQCSDCHRDPHRGAFQAACAQCHNTRGWDTTNTTISANFDHSRTRYPLLGRHSRVQCQACHKTSDFSIRVASARCTDCHADQHQGQFVGRPDRGDCASCHTVDGFETSTYDSKTHQLALYPLTGKHVMVACEKCHVKNRGVTNYHPRFAMCTNCHQDAHAGQFKEKFADQCDSCHTVDGFQTSTFSLTRHRDARFTLEGAHAAVVCVDCHKSRSESNPHPYRFEDMSCTVCHRDPHDLAQIPKDCQGCHSQQSWSPIRPFDHETTRFSLLGAHRTVTCVGCHKTSSADLTTNTTMMVFHDTPRACASCHEDIHASQFISRTGGGDCASCHEPARWKPANFDHNRSAYPLDGAHRSVKCELCHKSYVRLGGRQVLVYRNTPKECAQCH